jgi:hypothetical protein
MKITHEPQDKDAWLCLCGNQPSEDGFYPVNSNGMEVEPTKEDWDTENYICNRCGRIINQNTLEIVK